MKRTTLIFFTLTSLLFVQKSNAQVPQQYDSLINLAYTFYQSKDFKNSTEKYEEAFRSFDGKGYPGDRYNAACSYALNNQVDSAFKQLNIIVKKSKYSNYNHITKDEDLLNLHSDKRWKPLIKVVKENLKEEEKNYNHKLKKELEAIFENDQSNRRKINEYIEKYGRESTQIDSLWKVISYYDSINLKKVSAILDKKGWLGPNVVGGLGSNTLFLVIQHADLATQQKYLPVMRKAVSEGKAYPASLALLEDRVALGEGKKQKYGSQIGYDPSTNSSYVLPLEDADKVDEFRAEMGLGSISEYCSYFGITWNLEEYKMKLPYYLELQNKK